MYSSQMRWDDWDVNTEAQSSIPLLTIHITGDTVCMAYVMSIQFVYYDLNVFNISKISYDQFHKDFLLNL